MATAAEAIRRNGIFSEWLSFLTQVLIAISFEVADDLGRGLVAQHGGAIGNANALSIVSFEKAHDLWVEPGWQLFFEHAHRFLIVIVTWPESMRIMNAIYVGGHIFVTLGVALWLFVYRRRAFVFMRNAIIFTNLFALFIYERFPVAPPRLTMGLIWNGHPFTFQDTVFGVSSAHLLGAQAGYNELSAMPSVHMGWAILDSASLLIWARPVAVKMLGVLYPLLMLVAVVVTGNHYLLDVIVAVFVVVAAALAARGLETFLGRLRSAHAHPCLDLRRV